MCLKRHFVVLIGSIVSRQASIKDYDQVLVVGVQFLGEVVECRESSFIYSEISVAIEIRDI